jgi:hypothetical protein
MELWLVPALEFKRPPDGHSPEPAVADLAEVQYAGKNPDFCRPRGLAEAPHFAKISAEVRHAGKNPDFCRPRGLAEALNSAKISAGNFR